MHIFIYIHIYQYTYILAVKRKTFSFDNRIFPPQKSLLWPKIWLFGYWTVGSLKGKEELLMICLHLTSLNLVELGKQVEDSMPLQRISDEEVVTLCSCHERYWSSTPADKGHNFFHLLIFLFLFNFIYCERSQAQSPVLPPPSAKGSRQNS